MGGVERGSADEIPAQRLEKTDRGLKARELRLDYNGLKDRAGQAGPTTRSPKVDAQFVELFAAPASTVAPACECVVELENTRGAKMRVQLNGHGLAGLERLCSSFWGAR